MHILYSSKEVETMYQLNTGMRILYASKEVESEYRYAHFVCSQGSWVRIPAEYRYQNFVCFPGSWVHVTGTYMCMLPGKLSLYLLSTRSSIDPHEHLILWMFHTDAPSPPPSLSLSLSHPSLLHTQYTVIPNKCPALPVKSACTRNWKRIQPLKYACTFPAKMHLHVVAEN